MVLVLVNDLLAVESKPWPPRPLDLPTQPKNPATIFRRIARTQP